MGHVITKSGIVGIASQHGFNQLDTESTCEYKGKTYHVTSFLRSSSDKVLDCILLNTSEVLLGSVRTYGVDFNVSMIGSLKMVFAGDLPGYFQNISGSWMTEKDPVYSAVDEPAITEVIEEIKARRGQEIYKGKLMDLWNGCCALTGIDKPELLVGSHAKAWKYSNASERLDPYNGFLFEARIDKLFDKYLITFDNNGEIVFSKSLREEQIQKLGLKKAMRLTKIHQNHIPYLQFHREKFEQLELDRI